MDSQVDTTIKLTFPGFSAACPNSTSKPSREQHSPCNRTFRLTRQRQALSARCSTVRMPVLIFLWLLSIFRSNLSTLWYNVSWGAKHSSFMLLCVSSYPKLRKPFVINTWTTPCNAGCTGCQSPTTCACQFTSTGSLLIPDLNTSENETRNASTQTRHFNSMPWICSPYCRKRQLEIISSWL